MVQTRWICSIDTKGRSSVKEGALCMMGLEGNRIFRTATKQPGNWFECVLSSAGWTGCCHQTKTARIENGVVFHHNARLHASLVTRQKLLRLGWDLLPYSPDLAPSDYHLFRSLQNSLNGINFDSNEGIKNHLLQFFT